jgi:hypothetical protein
MLVSLLFSDTIPAEISVIREDDFRACDLLAYSLWIEERSGEGAGMELTRMKYPAGNQEMR